MSLPHLHALNMLVMAELDTLQKIFDHFEGDFEQAWHSSQLKKFLPVRPTGLSVEGLNQKKIDPEKEYARLQSKDIQIITIHDSAYPLPLKNITQPPFLLYVRGDPQVLHSLCFGIVGTRRPTDYGRRATPFIAEGVAKAGFTIVSGLAMGIDGLAHRAALKSGSPTIAVLGGGIGDHSVVAENRGLDKEISKKGGAIISEYAPDVHGNPYSFPQRNRLISGLCRGVLVVEADEKSGSLITARYALDQNRDVFAVPGSIFSPRSQGSNNLIKQGAKPVTEAEDILTEYQIQHTLFKPLISPANALERKILESIGHETLTLDQIIRAADQPTREVVSCLMNMELENKVKNLGNNKFCL